MKSQVIKASERATVQASVLYPTLIGDLRLNFGVVIPPRTGLESNRLREELDLDLG